MMPTSISLTPGQPTRFALAACLCAALLLSGCQSSRVRWNLFNWQNLDRVPPPATGSLSIPGVSTTALPTSTLPPPPSSLPSGTSLPYVNPQNNNGIPSFNGATGAANPGVYFNSPTGTPNWNNGYNTAAASNSGALTAIPGRDASTGWTSPTQGQTAGINQGNSGQFSNYTSSVPPLLNNTNFDPFSTERIPAWNPEIASNSNHPMTITSSSGNGNNAQVGWWPNQNGNASAYNSNGTTLGDGHVLRNMQQSVKNFFQQEPANLGGFQTTTPIQNPMILATGYNAGAPVSVAANPYMNNVTAAQGSTAAQSTAAQWAEYQRQQMDALRVQQMQQLQMAATNNPAFAAGSGQMQVLAESSTSRVAENQARLGIRSAANNLDPRYSGQQPQGSAAIIPR